MIAEIPPRNLFGRDSIAYWEDFLSPELLAYLLARPEWSNTTPAGIGGQSENNRFNPEVRQTDVGWLPLTPETQQLWQSFTTVVAEINRRHFHFDLTGCYELAQLGTYTAEEKGHYNWHTDAGMGDMQAPRKLSMVLCLSDPSEFEGGELQVKIDSDEVTTLELKKGRAWFFPSWVLHRVTPVTKGVRKSLVLWVGGPPFK